MQTSIMQTREMLNKILDYLKENGRDIGIAAKKGDKKAKRIIELYELIEARTEPVAIALLEQAITVYKGGGK